MKDFILFYSWIDVSEMNLSESHNKKKHDHHARNLEISDLCKAKNYSISFLSYPYLTLPYLTFPYKIFFIIDHFIMKIIMKVLIMDIFTWDFFILCFG